MEIWIKSQVVNLLNEIYNSDILEKTVSVVEGKSLLNKEYSKGGLDRNRGFYGKFMLLDILIDNMARGRKISDKQIEKGATADYIYYFDEDNMLKLVEKLPDTKYTSYEYISRKENCEIGVEINQWDSNVLNEGDLYITKTIYDNEKIKENIFLGGIMTDKIEHIVKTHDITDVVFDLDIEHYEYKDDLLIKGTVLSIAQYGELFINKYNYEFIYDQNGVFIGCRHDDQCEDFIKLKTHVKEFLSGSKIENKKTNLKAEVCKALTKKINDINEQDLCAISIFINDDDEIVTDFSINYNCEKDCLNAGQYDEQRWNYACWNGAEESLMEIIYAAGKECRKTRLKKIVTDFAKELQEQGCLKERFKKDIPIIIHDYEYSKEYLNATRKCNVNGEADDFFKWYNEEMR